MTLKVAYFQPVVLAIDNVPAVEFSQLYNLVDGLHAQPHLVEPDQPLISKRGGQQIQIYPNSIGLDAGWLIRWIETAAQGYMELIGQQSGSEELKYTKPVVVSIWTIRQTSGDYQEMHSHPAGHISGNIYISAPELEPGSQPSDSQILFRLPQTKDISKFIMQDTWKYSPTPGTVIMFPSYLPHTVYPWRGIGTRTIVAFDLKLVPKDQ